MCAVSLYADDANLHRPGNHRTLGCEDKGNGLRRKQVVFSWYD